MQYYVYHITSISSVVKNLKKIDSFDKYKEARSLARLLRAEQEDDKVSYQVIFAENEFEAEQKLQEKREAPILEEWEK